SSEAIFALSETASKSASRARNTRESAPSPSANARFRRFTNDLIGEHHHPAGEWARGEEAQGRRPPAGTDDRNTAAQKNRDQRHFDRVDETGIEQMPAELTAAEEPDIATLLRLEKPDDTRDVIGDDGNCRMIGLTQRARGDDDPLPLEELQTTTMLERGLKRAAANHEHVEFGEDLSEVDLRLRRNPVELALRTGDETVKSGRNLITDASHETRF